MHESLQPTTIVASFPSRHAASDAAHALRRTGASTWLGVTDAGDSVRATRSTRIARWLHRDSDRTLVDVLRERGVDDDDARFIDGTMIEGDAVLVADGADGEAIAREVTARGGTVRTTVFEHEAPDADGLATARRTAAERHPVVEIDDDVQIAVVREEFFIRRNG
jgi:predicted methyltransferase MtxX (methanogen marker protein 4)